jgi:hypothetical protein
MDSRTATCAYLLYQFATRPNSDEFKLLAEFIALEIEAELPKKNGEPDKEKFNEMVSEYLDYARNTTKGAP